MNSIKLFGVVTFFSLLFTACSNSSSGSSSSDDNNPPATNYSASSCQAIDNATLATEVSEATTQSLNFVYAITEQDGDAYTSAKAYSASAKATFAKALASYPNSCDAQFGYAVSLIADLVNNEDVSLIYNTFADSSDNAKLSLVNISTNEYSTVLLKSAALAKKANSSLITDRVQSVIANAALPALDSAIVLLKNVRDAKDYTYTITDDGDTSLVLDHGEFSMTLGALRVAKAVLTIVSSLNLDASEDNSYNWLYNAFETEDLLMGEAIPDSLKASFNKVVSLLDKDSPFLTIKSAWKTNYTAIPDLLDSAISNVQDGLNYKIEEGQGLVGDQEYAPYVVGSGEKADVSVSDLQKAVDSLSTIKKALHEAVAFTIGNQTVTVNLGKFFSITNGFQDYFPYHKFTNVSTWNSFPDDESIYTWESDISEDSLSVAAQEILVNWKKIYSGNSTNSSIGNYYYIWNSNLYFYYYDSTGDESKMNVTVSGCNYTYEGDSTVYTLSSDVCKTDVEGSALYKNLTSEDIMPDILQFTDEKGNVTAKYYKLEMMDNVTTDYLKTVIIFPDPTFGGIFPDFDNSKLWDFIGSF
ncbi:MAG: hypothetical protein M0P13_03895 [Fibrobacteraceae bacterium]|nr:hypothetical protein [Fibrobacteraceae bacterium]